jgi:hypothetical protein
MTIHVITFLLSPVWLPSFRSRPCRSIIAARDVLFRDDFDYEQVLCRRWSDVAEAGS